MSNDTQVETKSPGRGPSRWIYGVLVVSLGLNLLMVGGAAGAFWKHFRGHPGHGLTGFVRGLPEDRQPVLEQLIANEKSKIRPMRKDIRSAWGESNDALGVEPFEKEKMKAALARMNDSELKMRTAISDAIVELASQLTSEERKLLKVWRERSKERRHKRWKRDSDDDGDDQKQ